MEINRWTKFDELPEWISPNELALWLGTSPDSVYSHIKDGRLQGVKLVGGLRVSKQELKDYLERQRRAACHQRGAVCHAN